VQNITRLLGYLSIFTLIIFIPGLELLKSNQSLGDSVLAKILIGVMVFGINIPWFYSLYKANKYGDKKLYWYCFFFTAFGAWYFLFKIDRKYEQPTH